MYETLIEALRNVSEYDSDYAKLMYDAADAIEQLSNAGSAYGRGWTLGYDAGREENRPNWIPVTERLPVKGEWVLTHSKFVRPNTDFIDKHGSWYRTPAVTHWMPLPEPPKEE